MIFFTNLEELKMTFFMVDLLNLFRRLAISRLRRPDLHEGAKDWCW